MRIDEATLNAVEKWVADEFRSVNGQFQCIITEALKKNGRMKKEKSEKEEDSQPSTD
ncbi:hypothetical protein EZS27_027904 [termite gut metagenome]|uniref:Arc-like DNA binding domain-containing protein n=1 Tax=termite gut metagenome TaxID=433724 RepID=A0A5J4QN34_9ZZZZ